MNMLRNYRKPAWRLGVVAKAVAAALLVGGVASAFAVDGISENDIFRRNVSKTPTLKTNKSKIAYYASSYTEAAAQDESPDSDAEDYSHSLHNLINQQSGATRTYLRWLHLPYSILFISILFFFILCDLLWSPKAMSL